MKKYEKYKDSGVEWLGEIPEHWTVKCIKHTYTVNMGQSPDSANCNNEGIGIPFLQGNAAFGSINPIPESWCTELNKKSDINDILVSVRAPIGAVNISDQEYGIGRGLCAISGEVYNYIYYLFITLSEELNAHGTGSTFKAISVEQLKNINIPVPSNFEQQVISQYLEYTINEIETLIQEKSAFIAKLQEKRKALINEVVTKGLNPNAPMRDSGIEWLGMIPEHWKCFNFRYIIDILTDFTANGSFGDLAKNVNYLEEGYSRLVRLTDLRENLNNRGIYVSKKSHDYLSKSSLYGDEILLANVGAYAGLACLMPKIDYPATLGPNMFLLKFNAKVNNKFIYYALLSSYLSEQLINKAISSAQPKLNKEDVRSCIVILPSLSDQSEIVQFIESRTAKIDATIGEIKLQLQKLKEYKTAVISEVVTGKVDVREWKVKELK